MEKQGQGDGPVVRETPADGCRCLGTLSGSGSESGKETELRPPVHPHPCLPKEMEA